MGKLTGLNLEVYYNSSKIASAKTCTLSFSKRKLQTYTKTTAQTANALTHFSGARSWRVTTSINMDYDVTPNADTLTLAFVSDEDVTIRFTNSADLTIYFEGTAKVHDLVSSGGVNDMQTYSCVFEGNGPLTYQNDGSPPSPPGGVTSSDTWDTIVAELGRGYHYPISSQTTSYRTGDEANIESTIFNAARATNSKKLLNGLSDFTTLVNNNAFGNTNRFTDENGLQVYGSDYAIDHYTGLGWYLIEQGTATWNDQIDNALAASNIAGLGYSDWFLASASQVFSIMDAEQNIAFNYSPFSGYLVSNQYIHTSTTNTALAGRVIRVSIDSTPTSTILIDQGFTTSTIYGFFCRKHY